MAWSTRQKQWDTRRWRWLDRAGLDHDPRRDTFYGVAELLEIEDSRCDCLSALCALMRRDLT